LPHATAKREEVRRAAYIVQLKTHKKGTIISRRNAKSYT
jgi:hypothetical protein